MVIGGGAAGFFSALSVRAHNTSARITLIEKSDKLLAKVRISGGGRCNVTHACPNPRRFATHYPRGGPFLRKAFAHFGQPETVAWFAERGVELKTEPDGRMFPITDDSATIADLLLNEAGSAGVEVRLHATARSVDRDADGRFRVGLGDGRSVLADRVIVTTGGHPKPAGYDWLARLGHRIQPPMPSLFTFNMPGASIRDLMGVVADPVQAHIVGTDLASSGPLLITHWGMSGPAILRLSAWGARILHDLGYQFTVRINWLGGTSEAQVRRELAERAETFSRKQAGNVQAFQFPRRLWAFLLSKAGIDTQRMWGELPRKERDRLIDVLTNDRYTVHGKTTFKEEFVTAGGVDLSEVDPNTMESRVVPGLYFAGEVLDVDGITGGFNFQAAWTTGYLAGRLSSTPKTQ